MFDKSHIITYVMNIIFYIILSILLFLWLLSVICRRRRVFLSARNQQAVGPTIVAFPTIHELPPGLETTIIETFPKFPYSKSEHEAAGKKMTTGECAVCLGAFEEKEALRMLPKCGHVFHAECVDIWLRMHATCPFCRAILSPDDPQSGEGPTQVEVVVINEVGPPQVEVVINVNNNNGRER